MGLDWRRSCGQFTSGPIAVGRAAVSQMRPTFAQSTLQRYPNVAACNWATVDPTRPCCGRTHLGKLRFVIRLCDVSKRLWLEHHDFPTLEHYPLYVGPGT